MTASEGERVGVEQLSKIARGLMDMDTSVVIAGGAGKGSIRGLNGNGKNTIKTKSKKKDTLAGYSWL